ncbi:hypothetical protein [Deinococcus cellulosilyticus]|uniref:Uncharacterized protein n=1 Tax=Deinococcus cellulosilyticus (strain DSM 18568 / NBRC 106333 / KACC 11606 / 5516J-15) TaxID=1223518 RepID=A0A511N6K3_DEIC1|nr:hypothetical protein [Deinococcus cellulosilyticus]GEM48502.1 hypothetical protein DC3_41370 [Deinococcus cellulosilyticus NBRC 106333 = KACC 11606]
MTAVNQLTLKYLDEQNIFTQDNRFNIDIQATQEKFQELVARKIEEKKGLSANSVKFACYFRGDQGGEDRFKQDQGQDVGQQGSQVSQDELRQIMDEVKEEKQFWVVAE